MPVVFKKPGVERAVVVANCLGAGLVVATFVSLFGFRSPLLEPRILHAAQTSLLVYFVAEKVIRLLNSVSPRDYLRANWVEVPLLVILLLLVVGGGGQIWNLSVGVYLVIQVVAKVCRTAVDLAVRGRNPTVVLLGIFVVLIVAGAGVLTLPAAAQGPRVGFVDALFTATSATCVTGLTVKDTGSEFSLMGQVATLTLIQLGGLGFVVFGAVFALLMGQAFTVRQAAVMQDLLSSDTLSRIGRMIGFVISTTVVIEVLGAVALAGMWAKAPDWTGSSQHKWFFCIFHSISAFCNAGFGLYSDNLVRFSRCWEAYGVICVLIVLGGLGFGVLGNLWGLAVDRVQRIVKKACNRGCRFSMEVPKRMTLQAKIVLSASVVLIVVGTLGIFAFERLLGTAQVSGCSGLGDALFQSVSARTAGFNTVDIGRLSEASKLVLIVLMCVGGSPASTAGGIKTVTAAVILAAVLTTLRRRAEVEMFRRSIAVSVVGKAVTILILYTTVLVSAVLVLCVTERAGGHRLLDLAFESASALGTVGLSTGLTPHLTVIGKLILVGVMLVGRLGPLTLVAAMAFNARPARYNYAPEAVLVG